MRKYYQTEQEAIDDLFEVFGEPDDSSGYVDFGYTVYRYVAGILTIAVPYGHKDGEPRLLLRENEGLYWEVPDA